MTEAFTVQVDTRQLNNTLQVVARAGLLPKLMPKLAVELGAQVERNFSEEGRPKWAKLSAKTIAAREKKNAWPGKILQVTGDLARRVITDFGPNFAGVGVAGSDHPSAAALQFGAMTGRGRKVKLVARHYIPVDEDGNLQMEAETGLLDVTVHWMALQMA